VGEVMQTDTVFACFVEHEDFILYRGEAWQVFQIVDDRDSLEISIRKQDSDWEQDIVPLAPFDHVSVIVSFEDDPLDWQDVEVDTDADVG
jgi:hypothetical protein